MDPSEVIVVPRSTRWKVGLGAAVVLVLVGLGIAVLVSAVGSHGSTQSVSEPAPARTPGATGPSDGAPGGTIYVHILGAVTKPGLFLLKDGDRAVDAIAAAGGFTDTADQSQLNLARVLVDGEQISVPNVGEVPPAVPGAAGTVGGKINLNSADKATLETLPKVGPEMAKRIIDWRTTNGRFTAIEDLMSVSGVGAKTFEQLKDLVTV